MHFTIKDEPSDVQNLDGVVVFVFENMSYEGLNSSIAKKLLSKLFIPNKIQGIFSIIEYKPVPVWNLVGKSSWKFPWIISKNAIVNSGFFK